MALSAGFRAVPQKSYKAVGQTCKWLRSAPKRSELTSNWPANAGGGAEAFRTGLQTSGGAPKWLRGAANDLRTSRERPANDCELTVSDLRTDRERPANDLPAKRC